MAQKLNEVYDSYLRKKNHSKSASRYVGMEEWFHSSRAGLCHRKHFFGSIQKVKGSELSEDTLRIFRIGELIHEDIQEAVRQYAEQEAVPIFIEKELFLPALNVRGFIDLAIVDEDILYDIQTCNSYKWKMMFGRSVDQSPSENYALQLATYGLWYLENYGALKGMKIVYYNKNNSMMREVDIPMESLSKAQQYWESVVADCKSESPPPLELGVSPVYKWECNPKYCDYYEVCGGGIKQIME